MNTNTSEINVEDLKSSILQMQPVKPKTEEIFTSVFPEIQKALERGITHKAIRLKLTEKGLKIHAAKFKKMLEAAALDLKEKSMGAQFQGLGKAAGGKP